MKTSFNKTLVYFWFVFSCFFIVSAVAIALVAIIHQEYVLLFAPVILIGMGVLFYFSTVFGLPAINLNVEAHVIQIRYPFSFKKSKIFSANEIMGYYLNVENTSSMNDRSIVLIINKKEIALPELYYTNFKAWESYILKTYEMISHKSYRVYNVVKKERELEWYFASQIRTAKLLRRDYIQDSYSVLGGSVLGYLWIIYEHGFELNAFFVCYVILTVVLFSWLQYLGSPKKITHTNQEVTDAIEEDPEI